MHISGNLLILLLVDEFFHWLRYDALINLVAVRLVLQLTQIQVISLVVHAVKTVAYYEHSGYIMCVHNIACQFMLSTT